MMEDLAKLTKEEEAILRLTEEIWNKFLQLPNLQMWYVFFYRKKGGKVRGVLGRERTNDLLGSIL